MDWIQFGGLFVTMISGCAFLYKESKEGRKDIREDMRIQSARSDRLYEMFIEIQKDSDQKFHDLRIQIEKDRKDSDQKFYDMLKEHKSKNKKE